jgi:hypothetical protein
MMVLDRATMKNYLFEKNLWNFGKKIDHIVPRCEASSHGNSPGPTTLGGPALPPDNTEKYTIDLVK